MRAFGFSKYYDATMPLYFTFGIWILFPGIIYSIFYVLALPCYFILEHFKIEASQKIEITIGIFSPLIFSILLVVAIVVGTIGLFVMPFYYVGKYIEKRFSD